ncbi:MAG: glycoside hydrolase family 43 protein [Eubacterium sp.]|nr:glycoside hydrolase family 43 protein [Eubacterium sp.]
MVNKEKKFYKNPVVRGFFPDPSVIRAGEDFYLINSSFQYFPAIPIHHSRDLVHWELIGHAITQNEHLDLSDIADSHGIWAPDISYHDGKYYIFAPLRLNNPDDGNGSGMLRIQLVMTSDKPEGPYSKPWTLKVDSIDPSHFIDDDGTHYLITAPGVSISVLNDSCTEVIKPSVCAWEGTARCPEGPHIFKKDGWYYAVLAEGGTGYGHRISVARAKNIYGPYEECPHNPVMTQKYPEAEIQRAGHGKFVQTQNGDWWVMYLCVRRNEGNYSTIGRETALDPVVWTDDGWPVINGSNGPSAVQLAPSIPEKIYKELLSDDFGSEKLSPIWEWVRNPRMDNFSLEERPCFLRLKGSKYDLCDRRAYNVLVRREPEHFYTATIKLDYNPDHNGQEAGLVCYYGVNNYIKFCKCYNDRIKINVIENRNGVIKAFEGHDVPFDSGFIYLKVETRRQTRSFYFSLDNKNWKLAGEEQDCTFLCDEGVEKGKHHTGTMVGIYSYNPIHTFVNADFDWFVMEL